MQDLLREKIRAVKVPEDWDREALYSLLESMLKTSEDAMTACRKNWNTLCKPLYALGRLEELLVQVAGIQDDARPALGPAACFVFFADNGVVFSGVSQCGQEVTSQVFENMADGQSSVALWGEQLGIPVYPVDLAIADPYKSHPAMIEAKLLPGGTKDFTKEAAMTEQEALSALYYGLSCAKLAHEAGVRMIVGGEMGIGNTTTSTALASLLLGEDPAELCGRGAGLSDEGLETKRRVLSLAKEKYGALAEDPIALLAAVGGMDLAALTGLFLGAALYRMPVLLDGLITYAAALTASRICPGAEYVLLGTHIPREGACAHAAEALEIHPVLDLDIALGEGAGAFLLFPLLSMAEKIYRDMPSFDEGQVETYEDFEHPEA